MDKTIFLSSFVIVFLAELGDKTQLTAMALSARFPWRRAFIGIAAAFAVLNLAAVAVGTIVFELFGRHLVWIHALSGLLFLYFGIVSFRTSAGEEEDGRAPVARGPFVTAFVMIFLAELGDKTQIVTASLAAQHRAPVPVFLGSTLALWFVSLLGIFVGRQLARLVPLSYIHRAAGLLFLGCGLFMLYRLIPAGLL